MNKQQLLTIIQDAEKSKLTSLSLCGKDIKELPAEIGELTHLEQLDVSENKLVTLPSTIANLKNLRFLNLEDNHITKIPAEIGKLIQLEEVEVCRNKLSTLPKEFGKLHNLKRLSLRGNCFQQFPIALKQLTKLSELDLSENGLKSVLPEIGNLKRLTQLELAENQLTSLPNAMVNLSRLANIDLSYNQLEEFPAFLSKLTKLHAIDLSNNTISKVPTNIMQLHNLHSLSLRGNELIGIPDEIGNLNQLRSLDLAYNELSRLPKALTNLYALQDFDVSDNPLVFPPVNVVEKSLYAVMLYLSYGIDVAANQQICRLEMELPLEMRSILKQYLSYFSDYVRELKNKFVQLEVLSTKKGLHIEVVFTSIMDLEEIQRYLQEYLALLVQKVVTRLNFETKVGRKKEEEISQYYNMQIQFIQQLLLIRRLKINVLEERIQDFCDTLVSSSNEFDAEPVHNMSLPGPASS